MQYQGGKSRIANDIAKVIYEVSRREVAYSTGNSRSDQPKCFGGVHPL